MRISWRNALLCLSLLAAANPSFADEAEELRKLRDSTISLVNALVEQGVLTRAKADEIIAQARQAGAAASAGSAKPAPGAANTPGAAASGKAQGPSSTPLVPPAPPVAPGTVRVPYVPEAVKEEIRDQVKADVLAQAKTERWGEPGAFPDWLRHFTWYGDVRLRYQLDRYPSSGTPNATVPELQAFGVNITNSTQSDNLLRVRARFGFDATVGDTVTVGMRLATGGVGSGSNPGSENQTLGNYNSRSTVAFDRAYLDYHPEPWLGFTGGYVGNPFFKPTTLIWADDVTLEGLVARVNPQLGPHWSVFSNVGVLPIQQNDPSAVPLSLASSKWLYAYQAGFDLKFNQIADLQFAAALYDYRNIEGIPNPTQFVTEYNGTAAPFRQTGNTVFDINGLADVLNPNSTPLYGLASKFHELNLSTIFDLNFVGATHVILSADWVRNLGFDENEIYQRTGFLVDKQTTGWQTQVNVGHPNMQRKFNWNAWIGYRYVERDATVDAFTDQNFHLGGTDAKGYYLGGSFAFEKNSFISLRWFSAKQIDGVELAGADSVLSGLPLAIDVLQLDINAAF